MLELKRLSVDDGLDIYTMLQEIPAEENGLINKANGLTFDAVSYTHLDVYKRQGAIRISIASNGSSVLYFSRTCI